MSEEQVTQDHHATESELAVANTLEIHKNHVDRHYKDFSDSANDGKGRDTEVLVGSSVSDDSEIVLLIGSTEALGANVLSVFYRLSLTHILSQPRTGIWDASGV